MGIKAPAHPFRVVHEVTIKGAEPQLQVVSSAPNIDSEALMKLEDELKQLKDIRVSLLKDLESAQRQLGELRGKKTEDFRSQFAAKEAELIKEIEALQKLKFSPQVKIEEKFIYVKPDWMSLFDPPKAEWIRLLIALFVGGAACLMARC